MSKSRGRARTNGGHGPISDAYEHFHETGPRKVDYGPVLAVLDSLRDQFEPAEPELAGNLSDAIEQLKSARTAL